MVIGQKLKNARTAAGFTQETAAEKIGVSRQTVSNWENNRSYPDILSVLAMSKLYGVSLDELLKGDPGMTAHLEDSTNLVKSRKRLAKAVWFACYLLVWALCILFFWLGGRSDAMGYSLVVLYLVLPAATIAFSAFMGQEECGPNERWLLLLLCGFLYMCVPYATFTLSNMAHTSVFRLPELWDMLPGLLCAAAGMGAGVGVRAIRNRKALLSSQNKKTQ